MNTGTRQRGSSNCEFVNLARNLSCSCFSYSSAVRIQDHFFVEINISTKRVLHFFFLHYLPFPRRKIRGITWMIRTPTSVLTPITSNSSPRSSTPCQRRRPGRTPSDKSSTGSHVKMTKSALRLPIRCLRADCENSISICQSKVALEFD